MTPQYHYSFRLAGKEYEIDRARVEAAVTGIAPKPVGKYCVSVNGVAYPPKQVISVALGLPLTDFTTMDASRVLRGLGYEVTTPGAREAEGIGGSASPRNPSEQLFLDYLRRAGFNDVEYEAELKETIKRPDFLLRLPDGDVLFEVKEFLATADDLRPGFGAFDPYGPIREKINVASKQFRGCGDWCCCVVLYNAGKPLIDLSWEFVYAAMLGNIAYQIPIERISPPESQPKMVFSSAGGKMRSRSGPQNRTISAVLVLDQLPVGKRRFWAHLRMKEGELQQRFGMAETLRLVEDSQGTERDLDLRQLRVIVHENPFAEVALTRDIFNGPYDERFGMCGNGEIGRISVGAGMQEIEDLEARAFGRGFARDSTR